MATTLEIIDAIAARLRAKLPQFAVEFFPDKPLEYRLNHARGALLVSYAGGRYSAPVDVEYVAQPRELRVTVTVVVRQLNGRGGAVDTVEGARMALLGWRPPDCQKMRAVSETYLGERAGLWQYALDMSTFAVVIEDADAPDGPPFEQITSLEENP
jgi:hypothetical protein